MSARPGARHFGQGQSQRQGTSSLAGLQRAFAAALLDGDAPVPGAIASFGGSPPEGRFAVHRSNVAISLTEVLAGRYLIGADGARSIVRKSFGIDFTGAPYPETLTLTVTDFPFEDHIPGLLNVNYHWREEGNYSLMKVPGAWRRRPRNDTSRPSGRKPAPTTSSTAAPIAPTAALPRPSTWAAPSSPVMPRT